MKGNRSLLILPLLLVGAYLLVCLGAYLQQGSILYQPGPPPTTTPTDNGLEFEEVELTPEPGVTLHAWYMPVWREPRTVLICNGNAGNMAGRLGHARAFHSMGYSVLLFDWRGYGKSTGEPSEMGMYADAEAAWAWLLERGSTPEDIAVYGESLGGAVAVELAKRHKPGALVTEAAFTSAADVGSRALPFLPVDLLLVHRYESRLKAPAVKTPWLLLHSPEDEIVPYEHVDELRAAAGGPTDHLATSGGHNSGGFLQEPRWRSYVGEFLKNYL